MKDTIEKENIKNPLLNQQYTFDTFVQGKSNEMAYKAGLSIIEDNDVKYNPLFIYAKSCMGKTHLLQAIAQQAIKEKKSVVYVTAEFFLNDLLKHITYQIMDKFQSKYRECDIFLIDNIQNILGDEAVQERLLDTLQELFLLGKQIVVAGLKHPSQMRKIEKRLLNLFSSGLIVEITKPQYEMKMDIIKKKSELKKINLSDEMMTLIETSLGDSIVEIESFILQLDAHKNLLNQDINMGLIKNIIAKNL